MALFPPPARTILKYALFYHGNREFTENSDHSPLRKVTDRNSAFPNETAVMKILYLRTLDVVKKWTMPYPNWSIIRGKLDLLWGDGWDL